MHQTSTRLPVPAQGRGIHLGCIEVYCLEETFAYTYAKTCELDRIRPLIN